MASAEPSGKTLEESPAPIGPAAVLSAEDRLLLQRITSGDEKAFLTLVERNQRTMVRVALSYVPSEAVAEEVVQEAWIGILQGISKFEGRCPLRSWMFRILVNCARMRGGREARSMPFSSLVPVESDAPPSPETFRPPEDPRWPGHWAQAPEPWVDERLSQAEAARRIRAEIERLPPNQKQVITLRDIEDWDSSEVCELLGISEANQRVLLHRARTRVRKALAGWARRAEP